MERLKIAILFGGCSEEHDVSVKSAMEIAASIDTQKYEPIYIGITKSASGRSASGRAQEWEDGDCRRAVISPDRETHGLLVVDGDRCRAVHIDAVFPVLHGKSGEDGAVQGLLELSGIPYVGCDIQSSAICMDKSLAYIVARSAGIDTPEFSVLNGADMAVPDELAYPVFVKPARSGSSFGVTKVECADDLDAARHGSKALRRQGLDRAGVRRYGGRLRRAGQRFRADRRRSGSDQAAARHLSHPSGGRAGEGLRERGDHRSGGSARRQREQIRETAKSIYMALGCKGLARVDMFLQEDGRVVLNEVNTLPGFTAYSRYPRMMAAAGMSLSERDRSLHLVVDGAVSMERGIRLLGRGAERSSLGRQVRHVGQLHRHAGRWI